MNIALSQIADIVRGRLIGSNVTVNYLSTDTRNLKTGSLFIALKGKNYDAHNFVEHAIGLGAIALMVSEKLDIDIVPQILVSNTRIALGLIANWIRLKSSARVIAITGSSGKTSVKEMTSAILNSYSSTLSTTENMNNDIGVCLTLLRLTQQYDYAVIELGARRHGEISYSAKLVRPESILINNISPSHLDGFGSIYGVARAKGEILDSILLGGTVILNASSNYWKNWQTNIPKNVRVWFFSEKVKNSNSSQFYIYASNIQMNVYGTKFSMHTPLGIAKIQLSVPGNHNINNALAAAALSISVDVPLLAVSCGLKKFKAIPGRLYPINLTDGKLLFDDSYNANFSSMVAALRVLAMAPGYRIMIVGDMAELGEKTGLYHHKIGVISRSLYIDKILSIGNFSHLISQANVNGEHFLDHISISERAIYLIRKYKIVTVLIKGSRSSHMERVVQYLKEYESY